MKQVFHLKHNESGLYSSFTSNTPILPNIVTGNSIIKVSRNGKLVKIYTKTRRAFYDISDQLKALARMTYRNYKVASPNGWY